MRALDLKEEVSENFTLGEFLWLEQWQIYCFPSDNQLKNILLLAEKLELVRQLLGNKEVVIHCALRPPIYNKDVVKGALNSAHLYGQAVDFHIKNVDCDTARAILLDHLEEFDIRMENHDGPWVHIDIKEVQPGGHRFFKP